MATVTTKKRAITADDLYAITMVSDPQASPNGAEIAYVVTTLDKEADGYQSSIAIVETAGGTPWMLTCDGTGFASALVSGWVADRVRLDSCAADSA